MGRLPKRCLGLGVAVLLGCMAGGASAQCTQNPEVLPLVAAVNGRRDPTSGAPPPDLLSMPVSLPVSSAGQRDSLRVMVGAMLNLTIRASWGGAYVAQNLTLYAYEEPGLPNGASLGPVQCTRICNPISRQLLWTPAKGQEGKVHTMCFTSHPVNPTLAACVSAFRCIDIAVEAPAVTFDADTPADGLEMHSPVGCDMELCIQARDASGIYAVDVAPVAGTLPPGARFDVECAAVPVSGLPVPHPLVPGTVELQRSVYCRRCMHWEAQRGMETQAFSPCFTAVDQYGIRAVTTCLRVSVPKCKYCVQDGDTLHYINKRYRLNSNWIQLWNSNGIGEIESDPLSPATPFYDPDAISNGHSVINLGPSYSVQAGESLQHLAATFRTTVRKILDANPDITDPGGVSEGAVVCVTPCTDTSPTADAPNAQ